MTTTVNTKSKDNPLEKPSENPKYTSVSSFLKAHVLKKEDPRKSTNTRIPNKKTGNIGGNYYIGDEEYPEFLRIYADEIFKKGKIDHLTEAQRPDKGPLLVDIDLRHDYEIVDRQYTDEHIADLIDVYTTIFRTMFQLDDQSTISFYIFQKPTVNRVYDKKITKDGIHMICTLTCEHTTQMIIRELAMTKVAECWANNALNITNDWDAVFDEGISAGTTNWQLVGSCKPEHDTYKISHIYHATYDETDGEFSVIKEDITKFNIVENIHLLSARYSEHYEPFLTSEYAEKCGAIKNGGAAKKRSNPAGLQNSGIAYNHQQICCIRTREELEKCHKEFLDSIPADNYKLIEANDYTMALPRDFYEMGCGSYQKWFSVGCALRNIDHSLFIVWVFFSSQATRFDFSSIGDMLDQWNKIKLRTHNGLTLRSIMYWAKMNAPEKFKEIRENSIDFYIEQTIQSSLTEDAVSEKKPCGATDYDIASVLYQLKKDQFICSSIKGNLWYQYTNHRYSEIDSGTSLRMAISNEVRQLYGKKASQINAAKNEMEEGDPRIDTLEKRIQKTMAIYTRLGCTNDKKNIMTEAKDLFYDENFYKMLDTNPYLLCCTNGVWDFKEGIFRDGKPEDYISKCTSLDYIPLSDKTKEIESEIYDFMDKLFPVEELKQYMWDHLASTLVGTAENQTFNNYIGGGRNGKSVLITLMTKVLGEYKGDMPLTAVVTQKRVGVGGLAPEIAALKGCRYAVMSEPKMGDILNEGILKEFTSGMDTIQARAPYQPEPVKFVPQFKLVVCANVLPEIKAQDHGTWRRIRVVPFLALFTENPVSNDPHKPYQFQVDSTINEKFDSWKTVFLAMLVERVLKTKGLVKDCNTVLDASNEYKKKQDVISQFIDECIVQAPGATLKTGEVNRQFLCWHESNYGAKGPKPKELHVQLDKRFGNHINSVWSGIRLHYETKAEVPDEDEVDDIFG